MASLAKGVLLYFEDLETFDECMEEAHQLPTIKAVFRYAQYGELPEKEKLGMDGMMFFNFVRKKIDRDIAKYKETCEKNRLNGAKGGQTKAENLANASERHRTPPNRNRNRNKKGEIETVTEAEAEEEREAEPSHQDEDKDRIASELVVRYCNKPTKTKIKAIREDLDTYTREQVEDTLTRACYADSRGDIHPAFWRKFYATSKLVQAVKGVGYLQREHSPEALAGIEVNLDDEMQHKERNWIPQEHFL